MAFVSRFEFHFIYQTLKAFDVTFIVHGGVHSEAELFEIKASGLNGSFGEHSDGGDTLSLEVEALLEDGFEFGIVIQGYCSLEGIW
jgi:hypothetical protein